MLSRINKIFVSFSLLLCAFLFVLPACYADKPFVMGVEDSFTISGRGVVVTGWVERGEVKTGQTLELIGYGPSQAVTVTSIEMYRKMVDTAKAGDNVGLILRGVSADAVKRGQVLATPKTLKSSTTFTATIHLMPPSEGGRKTPVQSGYRPQVYLRTSDFSATMTLPKSLATLEPGADATVNIALTEVAALEKGQKFAIREGGKTIGTGTIQSVVMP